MATLELDGWGNGYAPPEVCETPSYFSELENCQAKLKEQIRATLFFRDKLKRLAEIESSFLTFGNLTFEEQQEKREILNQFI